jgi:hypothetical protein
MILILTFIGIHLICTPVTNTLTTTRGGFGVVVRHGDECFGLSKIIKLGLQMKIGWHFHEGNVVDCGSENDHLLNQFDRYVESEC